MAVGLRMHPAEGNIPRDISCTAGLSKGWPPLQVATEGTVGDVSFLLHCPWDVPCPSIGLSFTRACYKAVFQQALLYHNCKMNAMGCNIIPGGVFGFKKLNGRHFWSRRAEEA
ncbi:hypothetical protein SUGI_0251690 [Cryptomeria japonica]|nr:hypothetical protein SUGI_0251690 [Cryptomeria japonica]